MSYIAETLRQLAARQVRTERRVAMQRLGGKVAERDAATRKVRLDLGEDPETGAKILSPWVRVQSGSAGAFKFSVLPSIGEQMYLESPSGVVGADSVATFGAFDDDNPAPAQDPDELVIENGQTRFSMKAGQMKIKSGATEFTYAPGGFSAKAASFDWTQS